MNLLVGNGQFYSSLYGKWKQCVMCDVMASYGKMKHFMYNFENII
jgi:hypothetical protein